MTEPFWLVARNNNGDYVVMHNGNWYPLRVFLTKPDLTGQSVIIHNDCGEYWYDVGLWTVHDMRNLGVQK